MIDQREMKKDMFSLFPYLGIIPILSLQGLLYIVCMRATVEMFWRGAIVLALAYLAWISFLTGGMLAGFLLLFCIPIWLFISLYHWGYF